MQLDTTTYNDLSIFHHDEESSIFYKINQATTLEGKEWLHRMFNAPFKSLKQIRETQNILKSILNVRKQWPSSISNGTLMVMEKYYESNLEKMPDTANALNALFYKLLHGPDYAIVRYSISHFADFFRGLKDILGLLKSENTPLLLQSTLHRIGQLMQHSLLQELATKPLNEKYSLSESILYGNHHGDDFDIGWDCDIQCDEDPALAAYEAMLEAGICDNSVVTDTTQPKYIPDPTDDIPW